MSAASRFFDIAELTYMVVAHLDRHHTSMLVQTSRGLNRLCESSLFADLNIDYNTSSTRLFHSSRATRALARNIHYVKRLKISNIELRSIVNCMLAHLDAAGGSNKDAQDSRPEWLPSPKPSSRPTVPIPLLINLVRLELNVFEVKRVDNRRVKLFQFCWLLTLNPHLKELKATFLPIDCAYGLQTLAGSLSGLSHLHSLFLNHVDCIEAAWIRIGWTLFNSCNPSIHTVSINMSQYTSTKQSSDESDWNTTDQDQSILTARPTLVRERLRDLTMWAQGKLASTQDLLSVFELCPNLEQLFLPGLEDLISNNVVGPFLSKHCPKLRRLTFSEFMSARHVITPIKVMLTLPINQVEEFQWIKSFHKLSTLQAELMFRRHSWSLRKVVFNSCYSVGSKVVLAILCVCPVLEHFQLDVNGINHACGAFINLKHAISRRWACTNLQFLDLGVSIPLMFGFQSGRPPYYQRMPIVRLNYVEVELLAQFRRLYQQIGSLTSLKHLGLRAVLPYQDRENAFYHNTNITFPAMLSLGDEASDRPGFLDLLGGLTHLEELCGSVCINNHETEVTMGWKEARWMAIHWPALKWAELVHHKSELTEPFRWLQKELDLRVEVDRGFVNGGT
ncbi:MAG: hypothetical protein J3R72DRAFT_455321 [Linnemannia gamsii]|nr:MAG: hypothetical protein J3R72DRAFT_455321 [Linnemannia gamsii]